jgi:hypothetical protein
MDGKFLEWQDSYARYSNLALRPCGTGKTPVEGRSSSTVQRMSPKVQTLNDPDRTMGG